MEPILKDIHNPVAISWWPPAPGWYVLVVLVLLIIIAAVFAFKYYKRKNSIKKTAMDQFKLIQQAYARDSNAPQAVQALNKLLRQVSLAKAPRENVASLFGLQWLQFLDKIYSGDEFETGAGKLLVEEAYKKNSDLNLDALFALIQQWLQKTCANKKAWREVENV